MEKNGKKRKNAAMSLFEVSPFQKRPINMKIKLPPMEPFDFNK
jgi:hypothetical protein